MRIKFVVVAHHTRRHQAEQLARSLRAHLLIDDGHHGATGIIVARWTGPPGSNVVS
jgi:hypothetical protein